KRGENQQGGGFRFPPPCTHPLKRPIRGASAPLLDVPPRAGPTGSLPAAKAYFVTPPPLERRRKRPCFSGAWHRRRPGGPGRYNATVVRACKVIPMRATQ